MKKFIVLYSGGGAPSTPEEGAELGKIWMEWFATLGPHLKDYGASFGDVHTVDGTGTHAVHGGNISNGYSLFEAESLDAVSTLVKHCPILAAGGKVHVFALADM